MSNIFSIYRNSYLHTQSTSVNSRIINRCVDLARNVPIVTDCSYFNPPWNRLASEQPITPLEEVDITRRYVAFGNYALIKLRRELANEDDILVVKALLSLNDLVKDPEYAYQALQLKIPQRLSDKLLDPLVSIREGAVSVLTVLAELADGRESILSNGDLLENLFLGLGDSEISVRYKVATCFEMIARCWMAADVLVNYELVERILDILEQDEVLEIKEFHLQTLKSLMYDCGKCLALKNNAYRILIPYLDSDNSSIVCKALDCLMILISTKKGKKLSIQKDLLTTLNKLLHYGDTDVCTGAASVIMFATVKTRAKHLAVEMDSLIKRLVKLTTNPINTTLQMYALKALTNICEHPNARKFVNEYHLSYLMKLEVDVCNLDYKNILIKTLAWLPEHSF